MILSKEQSEVGIINGTTPHPVGKSDLLKCERMEGQNPFLAKTVVGPQEFLIFTQAMFLK